MADKKYQTTITIGAVKKEISKAQGNPYWGVKNEGTEDWYNLFRLEKPSKGEQYTINVNESIYGNGRISRWSTIVASQPAPAQPQASSTATGSAPTQQSQPQPRQPAQSNGHGRVTPYTQSFEVYEEIARKAHALALELEPDKNGISSADARGKFVDTFLMALGEGKLTMEDDSGDPWVKEGVGADKDDGDWAKTETAKSGRTKQEPNVAHDHLAQVLTSASLLTKENPIEMLGKCTAGLYGESVTDITFLTEKEAIQVRQVFERLIDDKTDWRLELTKRAKAYCEKAGINFKKENKDILLAIAGTRDFEAVDNVLAKKALEVLREVYESKLK